MEKRNKEIKIRATEKEKAMIQRNAKKCGLSVTKYLVNLASGYNPREIPSDNFYEVRSNLRELLDIYYGETDPYFCDLTKQIYSDLYHIYIKPYIEIGGENSGNDKNMGD